MTLLETVRELKELGISVYFEEQSIDTATADGELMLSILARNTRLYVCCQQRHIGVRFYALTYF